MTDPSSPIDGNPREIDHWARLYPTLCGPPEVDARRLCDFVSAGEALVRQLPPKPDRSHAEANCVAQIMDACRRLRRDFLSRNVNWVYERLTENRTVLLRVEELVRRAAILCPGLVPSASVMLEEVERLQVNKEGHEIDQGLFFHAMLAEPGIAAHLLFAMQLPTIRALELLPEFRASGRAELQAAKIERRGVAAYVTITNEHCLNSEDLTHVLDMETAVDLVLLDPAVHVGVVRGGVMTHPRYVGRRVFSAGINLKALRAGKIPLVEFFLGRELGYINKILRGIYRGDELFQRVEKPWIGVVDGFAIGGGAQLLLTCDQVIAGRNSYISLPAAQEGIVPGCSNLRLTRFLGSRLAREMILCGRVLQASDGEAAAIIGQVVDEPEMDKAIAEAVGILDNPAVISNRRMLLLAEEPDSHFLAYAAEFALQQSQRIFSRDVLDNIHKGGKATAS